MCMLIWDEIGMRCYPFVSLQFMRKLVAFYKQDQNPTAGN